MDDDFDDHYEDYSHYEDSGEYGGYVDVEFPSLTTTTKSEIPKECQRKDVCYIIRLCIKCKPFFKNQL